MPKPSGSLPGERATYLDEASGGDAALRERVEILLHSHDEAGTFLAHSATEDFDATLDVSVDDRKAGLDLRPHLALPGDLGGEGATVAGLLPPASSRTPGLQRPNRRTRRPEQAPLEGANRGAGCFW